MKSTLTSNAFRHLGQTVLTALTFAFTIALVSCGGGGTTPVTDVTTASGGVRALPADFTSRRAVNYSPYRTATSALDRANETITDAQVLEDLTLVRAAGFGMIRLFDSDEKVAQRVLRVIEANNLDIKVYLGMWMAGYDDAGNKNQMAYGVALANSYPNIVVAVSVGNESLVNWGQDYHMQTDVLAANIKTVRNQITQPVTTDDNWAYYAAADRVVLDAIDFASIHTYAMVDTHYNPTFWDWQQLGEADLSKRAVAMMDAALASSKSDYNKARTLLDSKGRTNMPIIIGETGWMAVNPSNGWYKFLAHPVNQKLYLDRLMAWADEGKLGAGPKNIFYFEAFDEPWKRDDNGWGLFNVNRQARCAAQSLNLAATWVKETGSCDDANAIYFKLPTLNQAIADSKLVIHSETVTGWPAGLRADAFGGGVPFDLAYPATGDSSATDLGAALNVSNYIKLSNFGALDGSYGWGLLWQSSATPDPVTANMSNFANGAIHFSVKTGYVGKLRIGISSDTDLGVPQSAYVYVGHGDYGYCSSTTPGWCDVSIPVSAFKVANPALDLRYILIRFSIADIWSETGNTARSGMPEIRLDNVYWAQ